MYKNLNYRFNVVNVNIKNSLLLDLSFDVYSFLHGSSQQTSKHVGMTMECINLFVINIIGFSNSPNASSIDLIVNRNSNVLIWDRKWSNCAEKIAEVNWGLLFCSLFDPIMLCEEAPSVDILLSTIRSIHNDVIASLCSADVHSDNYIVILKIGDCKRKRHAD